jgi:lipopolysaccharide export LptBFGC system permease protein LptF
MNGKRDERLERLFAATRNAQPETSGLELHFETRLMATLRERRDSSGFWLTWLWRLIPVFTVLLLMLGIASISSDLNRSRDLFAAIAGHDGQITTSYLVGE